MNIIIKLLVIVSCSLCCIATLLYAGGDMKKIDNNPLYNNLLKKENEGNWLFLTDSSKRVEPSFKKLFVLCSLNFKNNKKLDISLFTPKEWPSKNLGSYALSPDGSKIAFTISYFDYTTEQNLEALYIMHIQSEQFRTILPPRPFPTIGSLSWFPNGKKLFFVGKLKEIKEPIDTPIPQFNSLYSLDIETMNIDTLIQYNVFDINSQSFSPDASEMVFENSKRELYIYDLKTKTTRKLTDGTWSTWCPIDNTIAFFGPDENYYFINSNGNNKHLFIKNEYVDKKIRLFGETIGRILGRLLWSPDGQYVYFEKTAIGYRFADTEHYIPYVMNVNTKEEIRLPDKFLSGIKSWIGNRKIG